MAILATYVSASTFYVSGECDQEFEAGRAIRLFRGDDGNADVYVLTASYDVATDRTSVIVSPASVLASLVSIERGAVSAKSSAEHGHTGHGDGGLIPASQLSATQVSELIDALNNPVTRWPLTAGEALTQYQVVYQDAADSGKCKLAQADLTEQEADAVGMVDVASIAEGDTDFVLLDGIVNNDAWTWTAGASLYVSDTPGALTEIPNPSSHWVRCARALTSTHIRFHNPFFDTVAPTE